MAQNDLKLSYDTTLLEQGKYRQWFWLSLSQQALGWLKRPQCPTCRQTLSDPRRSCDHCSKAEALPPWVNREGSAWRLEAACRNAADPEIFFPPNRVLYNNPDAEWRKYCFDCPVVANCSIEGERSKALGVWGGAFRQTTSQANSTKADGTGRRGRPRKVLAIT